MATKRELKKTFNYVCGELMAEAVAASLYKSSRDKEATETLLSSIIRMRSDFVRRISHPEPGMSGKAYYRHITDDFNRSMAEVIDQIGNLG